MFEYSFVPSGRTRRPLTVGIACLGEAMLIGSLVLVPMLFVQSLPNRALFRAIMLAPVPMAPPAPPPPMLAKRVPRTAPPPRTFDPNVLVSPVVVPKVVAIISEAPPLEMDAPVGGVPGGIPGVGGAGTGFFSNALSAAPPPPPPPPPPVKIAEPTAPKQITVGGEVQAAMLLERIEPVYPKLARTGHIRGIVELKAIIGADGKIKVLTPVSGQPMLVEAALDAVRRWIYRPTILNGVPVEVNTRVIVRFGLTS